MEKNIKNEQRLSCNEVRYGTSVSYGWPSCISQIRAPNKNFLKLCQLGVWTSGNLPIKKCEAFSRSSSLPPFVWLWRWTCLLLPKSAVSLVCAAMTLPRIAYRRWRSMHAMHVGGFVVRMSVFPEGSASTPAAEPVPVLYCREGTKNGGNLPTRQKPTLGFVTQNSLILFYWTWKLALYVSFSCFHQVKCDALYLGKHRSLPLSVGGEGICAITSFPTKACRLPQQRYLRKFIFEKSAELNLSNNWRWEGQQAS